MAQNSSTGTRTLFLVLGKILLGPVKKTILYAPGKNEEAYIMDAKVIGNLGRYMNHSCRPNVFVQNVFIESHDLRFVSSSELLVIFSFCTSRFPTIAFFTFKFVPAGSELCWNYNYEVKLFCSKIPS